MLLAKETEYALRAILCLATFKEKPVPLQKIAEREKIPSPFLFKIFQSLCEENILAVKRGRSGGYSFCKDLENISLLNVIQAVERSYLLKDCLDQKTACPRKNNCSLYPIWENLQKTIENKLAQVNLKTIIEQKG